MKRRERMSVSEGVREGRRERNAHTDTQRVGDRSTRRSGEQVKVTVASALAETHTKVFVELSHTLVLFICVLSWLWFSEVATCGSTIDHASAKCVFWSGVGDCNGLVRTGK